MADEPVQGSQIIGTVIITLGVIALGGFGLYYFFAPPPPMTIEEATRNREQQKESAIKAVVAAQQEAEFNTRCGQGWSGGLCRLKQGACDTALGGYFCFIEGRETGDL